MKQTSASRRINEAARMKIASILLNEVSDPRISLVTVTDVEVSLDRSVANVFVSAGKDRYEDVEAGLESAKGRIRHLLAQELGWRVTPELRFIIDTSVDDAERITKALENVPPTMVARGERAAHEAGAQEGSCADGADSGKEPGGASMQGGAEEGRQ